jgi:hypothetical protein
LFRGSPCLSRAFQLGTIEHPVLPAPPVCEAVFPPRRGCQRRPRPRIKGSGAEARTARSVSAALALGINAQAPVEGSGLNVASLPLQSPCQYKVETPQPPAASFSAGLYLPASSAVRPDETFHQQAKPAVHHAFPASS